MKRRRRIKKTGPMLNKATKNAIGPFLSMGNEALFGGALHIEHLPRHKTQVNYYVSIDVGTEELMHETIFCMDLNMYNVLIRPAESLSRYFEIGEVGEDTDYEKVALYVCNLMHHVSDAASGGEHTVLELIKLHAAMETYMQQQQETSDAIKLVNATYLTNVMSLINDAIAQKAIASLTLDGGEGEVITFCKFNSEWEVVLTRSKTGGFACYEYTVGPAAKLIKVIAELVKCGSSVITHKLDYYDCMSCFADLYCWQGNSDIAKLGEISEKLFSLIIK